MLEELGLLLNYVAALEVATGCTLGNSLFDLDLPYHAEYIDSS